MLYRLRFHRDLALDGLKALFSVPLECAGGDGDGSRSSPPARLELTVGGRPALLCYGRPSVRGRKIFGDLLPFGEIWRLGANEPTVLHMPFAATVAGVRVRRGKLALYAVPHPEAWTLVLNRSTRQWGITRPEIGGDGRRYRSAYTAAVRSAELGRVPVRAERVPFVETLTASAETVDDRRTDVLFEWETTRVRVPIEL